jgi:hypothetical protein
MGYTGQRPSAIPLTTADIVDGTISNADLAGSITSAKITSLDATKLTGTVAPARMGSGTASSTTVLYGDGTYKTEPVTDTTSIKNDISLLALQTAINGNLSAYGLKNSWIEQFENSTYIANLSTVGRDTSSEYVSSIYTSGPAIPANTKLLIHSNTTDGSTTFTDSSASPHTLTTVGNAQHDTAQQYFGTTSMLFDGTGDNLSTPASADWAFGTGDFTVACWIRPASVSGNPAIVGNVHSAGTDKGRISLNTSGNYRWGSGDGIILTGGTALSTGVWKHIAFTRSSGTMYAFIDGVADGSATYTANLSGSYALHVGNAATTEYFNGHLDEVLWVKGTALWTSGFDVPTGAYAATTTSATGSFTSTVVVPQDAVNKSSVGLVILYKDQAGTTTFNGANQLVAKVRANAGQAYQEVVLAGAGTYSDGLKIAIAPAIAVTAGQALSYEISFAGQSASLETRVHGVAMTY